MQFTNPYLRQYWKTHYFHSSTHCPRLPDNSAIIGRYLFSIYPLRTVFKHIISFSCVTSPILKSSQTSWISPYPTVREKGSFWCITFPSLNHRIHANIKYAFLPATMYPFIRNRDPYWSALSRGIFDNLGIYYYYYYFFYLQVCYFCP